MVEFKKNILELFKKIKNYLFEFKVSDKKVLAVFFVSIFIAVIYIYFQTPPKDFPVGKVFSVSTGESLEKITNNLYEMEVIRSPLVFRSTVILLGGEKNVIAGDYLLDKKEGPADLAYRLTNGKFHLEIIKITIPEGWSTFEIADYLEKSLLEFDTKHFAKLAQAKEGYLFPDTYFVSPAIKPKDLIEKMAENFNEKIPNIEGLSTTTYKLKDVITMASILEKEARTMESRRIIAGILWKRIQIGMPLQVDSTFLYINGKNTYDLTLDDLKIDSPYNTYRYKGLPVGPIGNPGEDSIIAAINPIKTKYLYFLSSKSGEMYYATTFEQHKKNKQLYLNN